MESKTSLNFVRKRVPWFSNAFWREVRERQPILAEKNAEEEMKSNAASNEDTEKDYLKEHQRVGKLIESRIGKTCIFESQNIFSLPNEEKYFKLLKSSRYLDFKDNNLKFLPDEMEILDISISLDLSKNKFSILPWQIFTIGQNVRPFDHPIVIYLTNNPITRIPEEFFEKMMEQERKRELYVGFYITLNQDVIEDVLLPALEQRPTAKSFLEKSINLSTKGYCKFQNENGETLTIDQNGEYRLTFSQFS